MELEQLKCPNCGAPLNPATMKCEYCGAQFKREYGDLLRIETVPCGTQVIKCAVAIPRRDVEYMGSDMIQDVVRDEMTRKVAEAIFPLMDIKVSNDFSDPFRGMVTVRGRIRIVRPGYKF